MTDSIDKPALEDSAGHRQQSSEADRASKLKRYENLERISQVIRKTNDYKQMMEEVLNAILSIYECDRAWLLTPCNPDAASWSVPMECTTPEYPGVQSENREIPMTPKAAAIMREALQAEGTLVNNPNSGQTVSDISREYSVKSQMLIAIYPNESVPWILGVHQCTHERVWTEAERALFKGIGVRVADSLGSLLLLRDLRKSEEILHEAQRIARMGNWTHDLISDTVTWSPEMFRIAGLQPREVTWDLKLSLTHPDDREMFARAMAESEAGKQVTELEFRVLRPDGETRYIHDRWESTYDSTGKERFRVGIFQDVTERRQALEALEESEKRYRTLQENVPLGVFRATVEKGLISVNDALVCMFGYDTSEELLAVPTSELYCDSERRDELMEILASQELLTGVESEMRQKDGSTFWISSNSRATVDDNQNIVYFDGIIEDITNRRQAEEALQKAHDELEERVVERTAELAEINKQLEVERCALQEKNTALKEVLNQIEDGKKQLSSQIQTNITKVALPILQHLKNRTDPGGQHYLELLRTSLEDISSPLVSRLETRFWQLTPREIEVCNMIKNGMTCKKIATTLNNSEQTVLKQRKLIRRKLGITNKKINLVSYLRTVEHNSRS